jgi:hypothetical protein
MFIFFRRPIAPLNKRVAHTEKTDKGIEWRGQLTVDDYQANGH